MQVPSQDSSTISETSNANNNVGVNRLNQTGGSAGVNSEVASSAGANGDSSSLFHSPGESRSMYIKVNIMRSLFILMTVIIVLFVAEKLDKFISVMGAIFGMTNVLLLPAICHLRLVANTRAQQIFDIFIIVFASVMIFFGPATIIMQWQ